MTNPPSVRFRVLASLVFPMLVASVSMAQNPADSPPQDSTAPAVNGHQLESAKEVQPPPQEPAAAGSPEPQHELAERQLKQEERQRILGIIPNFNTSEIPNAVPLTPGQKWRLALRGSIDPFQFLYAGLDAAISQRENEFPGYGQGAQGYFKRFGAAFTDQFSGQVWGNAIFPILLREDPRYFRKGHGSFRSRLFYAVAMTAITKNDNGTWGPNYANVLGNLAAGGMSNIYYPSTDRGVALTFERAFTVTAEGAIAAIFAEFWPDVANRIQRKHPAEAPQPKQN